MSAVLKSICDLCKNSVTHEAEHRRALWPHTHDELMLYFSYMPSVPKGYAESHSD